MYDRFADKFRYVPLNGDIAGCCARTDQIAFPWFSPAGTTRGAVLNGARLAYNPTQIQRDRLYSARINPVVFSNDVGGMVLYGDKTALSASSAFDRINVRRLFIYIEEAISNAAAKDQLFEFNDEVTRTNFVNIVEPFLRDVQSKRGITDFVVVCDETNNTPAVIDRNEFVADIFVKPTRSINFIGLTFVATRSGVSFEESSRRCLIITYYLTNKEKPKMASTRKQVESPVLRTISDFKAKMTGGGARPNLFEVVLQFPLSAPTDTDTLQKSCRFLVKAAALPSF